MYAALGSSISYGTMCTAGLKSCSCQTYVNGHKISTNSWVGKMVVGKLQQAYRLLRVNTRAFGNNRCFRLCCQEVDKLMGTID